MQVLYILLAALAALLVTLLFNTLRLRAAARKLQPAPARDLDAEHYARRLAKMIRCKTVSYKDKPYDDAPFAQLRDTVRELFPLVHARAEKITFGDDCWVFCLKGKNPDRRILLMSHHDVVAAEGEWQHDPFGGELADGRIWGRGTVDTKTPLFAEFSALEELLAEGFEPPCSVYIASSHNEEYCGDGIPKANEYFKKNGITFEVVLDEGGGIIDPPLGGMQAEKCAMVAVHEKGRIYLNCTATAANGHAGLAGGAKANPVERMAAFIHEIQNRPPFIRRMNTEVSAMFRHLAPYAGFGMGLILSNLWLFGPLLKKIMPKLNPQAGGMIGTTCTFNGIEGKNGNKACTAAAFLRPVDGDDLQKDIDAFRAVAAKYDIAVEMEDRSEYHGPADMNLPAFAYTMDCIGEVFPHYPAAPFILPAGSDARTLTDVCPCVLRFAPIRLSAAQLASVHAEDENIDITAVADCVTFYKHFVKNYK